MWLYLVYFVSQVFSMFLETLVDFITVHREDLQDWLFVLLTQLLKKMGADLLGSVQAKVQRALDVTRLDAFLNQIQFKCLFNVLLTMFHFCPAVNLSHLTNNLTSL